MEIRIFIHFQQNHHLSSSSAIAMVQRKLPTKLTLQLDHAKAQSDLKSPRGADLKAKKMKKSRSLKRPKHPGKPPPPPAAPRFCKTPNYMKSTTSSDARKEQSQPKPRLKASPSSSSSSSSSSGGKKAAKTAARALTKNPSFKPARKCSPVIVCESSVDAKRATCSSTLKDCKFPDFLSLNPEGTSAMKVCPYTYCSLNGHRHRPLPPLKSFLSARRLAIKTQRSVKIGCLSPRRAPAAVVDDDFKSSSSVSVNPLTQEEENNDFFVEIYSAGIDQTVAQDEEERVCEDFGLNQEEIDEEDSDMEWETAGYGSPLQIDYNCDYECSPQTHVETNPEADEVDIKVSSDEKDCCCVDEFVMDEASQESIDEEGLSSDAFSSSDDDDNDGDGDDDQHSFSTSTPLQEEESQDYQVSSSDDLNHENEAVAVAVIGEEPAEAERGISSKAVAELETEDIALLHFTANAKKLQVEEDGDDLGAFNPRGLNFLPLEPDPEAEKVDLRHQDLDERKNSEEWMVDFALRQVVTKLGPARKRKVALLVEAFEKVMPTTKFDLHLRHASSFDQPRPMQACS